MERQEVLQKACDLLASREHSRKELRQRLGRICRDADLVEMLLDKLAEKGLQSDARFTESFIHQRYNKGQGPLKIEQELRQRGIQPELIATCLHESVFNWLGLAEQERKKRFGEDLPADYQKQAKQARFLYSRGFTSEQIGVILKK